MTERPIARQLAAVEAELRTRPRGLVAHVRRVRAEALSLAARWDADPERVELAVWGHDLFRAHRPEELAQIARAVGVVMDPVEEANPVLVHGPIAAAELSIRFGVTDAEVLAAVRDHTAGGPQMSLVAAIMLIADKVERRKRRRAAAMRSIRRVARRDLDLALLCWADWRWVEAASQGWVGHSAHWNARVAWVGAHHAEVGLPARTWDEDFEAAARDPG